MSYYTNNKSSSSSSNSSKMICTSSSRLVTDLREWNENKGKYSNIIAMPLNNNIYEWHCTMSSSKSVCNGNLKNQFEDVEVHLILYFANQYPFSPPNIRICNHFAHPKVKGSFIDLNLVCNNTANNYYGWTPGYSVLTLLLQLESFLFSQNNKWTQSKRKFTFKKNKHFTCIGCGYGAATAATGVSATSNYKEVESDNVSVVSSVSILSAVDHDSDSNSMESGTGTTSTVPDGVMMSMSYQKYEKLQGFKTKSKGKKRRNGNNNAPLASPNGVLTYKQFNKRLEKQRAMRQDLESQDKLEENNGGIKKIMTKTIKPTVKAPSVKVSVIVQTTEAEVEDIKDEEKTITTDVVAEENTQSAQQGNEAEYRHLQRQGFECWLHRSSVLSIDNSCNLQPLCLGYGIVARVAKNRTLGNEIFGSNKMHRNSLKAISDKIGDYARLSHIETTFDLLSSNAFDDFNIRRTKFNETYFEHFIPIYINKNHGKLTMKCLKQCILSIYSINGNDTKYHPFLAVYTVANILKSLIVSLISMGNRNNGKISSEYGELIVKTFMQYHHLLLAIYYHNKKKLKPIIQDQINLFFQTLLSNNNNINNNNSEEESDSKNEFDCQLDFDCRNKTCVPDLSVFMIYLLLWERDPDTSARNGLKWDDIGLSLLDELFTRQVKWLLDDYPTFVNDERIDRSISDKNKKLKKSKKRVKKTFQVTEKSRQLFIFECFFINKVCNIFGKTPTAQYFEYNKHNGVPMDDINKLSSELESFAMKAWSADMDGYQSFLELICLSYPGDGGMRDWLLECLWQSQKKYYHNRGMYRSRLEQQAIHVPRHSDVHVENNVSIRK